MDVANYSVSRNFCLILDPVNSNIHDNRPFFNPLSLYKLWFPNSSDQYISFSYVVLNILSSSMKHWHSRIFVLKQERHWQAHDVAAAKNDCNLSIKIRAHRLDQLETPIRSARYELRVMVAKNQTCESLNPYSQDSWGGAHPRLSQLRSLLGCCTDRSGLGEAAGPVFRWLMGLDSTWQRSASLPPLSPLLENAFLLN